MRKMLIGLSGRVTELHNIKSYYDFHSYFEYVSNGGAIPLMLGAVTEDMADEIARQLDGLMITGGEDVDPALYGQENTASDLTLKEIEYSDIYLYNSFKKLGKPILLICRGMQIANVIEGGTLIQDIPSADAKNLEHNQLKKVPPIPRDQFSHTVKFTPGTELHRIFGDVYGVNTFHHQGVDRLADGFCLAGVCPDDGIIEAFENDLVLAVQWHPERHTQDEKHKTLFQVFLRRCESVAEQTV